MYALLFTMTPCAAGAVAPASTANSTTPTGLDDVIANRKDLAAQAEALAAQGGSHAAVADVGNVSTAEDELEFLETLDGVYAQQQVRLEQQQELQAESKKAQEDLDAFRKFGPTEAKPYSFLLLEDLRDELASEEDHDAAFNADLKPAGQLLETARSHFDLAEKDRRRVQEQVAEEKHSEREAALATELKLAQRESQISKELIVVRRLEVEVRTLRRDVCVVAQDAIDGENRAHRQGRPIHSPRHARSPQGSHGQRS